MARPIARTEIRTLEDSLDAERLAARLREVVPRTPGTRVVVGVSHESTSVFATVGSDAGANEPVLTGCCTKLFTCALLRRAIADRMLTADSLVTDILDLRSPTARERLNRITVRDLAEHTHGLNAAEIHFAPRSADGCLDTEAVVSRLTESRPLTRPGWLYNYGHAGAWLACTIVETLWGAPYERLLDQKLLRELGIRRTAEPLLYVPPGWVACGATGGTIAMPIRDLLTFACAGTASTHPAQSLPGWAPLEQGIQFGWHTYAGGWIGHNSVLPFAPMFLRVSPTRNVAAIVVTNGANPGLIAARLLGKALPDLLRIKMPQPLNEPELRELELQKFSGTYADERTEISIRPQGSTLQLRAHRRRDSHSELQLFAETELRPAAEGVLVPHSAQDEIGSFVQPILWQHDRFGFLWNGQSVLANLHSHEAPFTHGAREAM